MLTVEQGKVWLAHFAKTIEEKKAYLSELDTPIGDGDHGNNMARGMIEVSKVLKEKEFADVSDLFKGVAFALISKVGGASGPLYGTAFLEMSKTAKETTDVVALLESGLSGIKKRGSSEVGQKTMIDLWEPAIGALKEGALTKEKLTGFVEATKDMVATKGRASYLGDRSVGHMDPGAMSSNYLFVSLLEAVK